MTSSLRSSRPFVRPLAVAVALVGVLLGASACSGSSSSSSSTSTKEPSSPAGANAGDTCGVHKVGDVQVRTFCGGGTAAVKGGAADLSLTKASCETSTDYVAVNAGTVVLGSDDASKKVKASTQYIGLTVGKVPGDTASTAATGDGTYTGGILAVNDKGTALPTNPKTLKITLTKNRTAGTFTGTLIAGGTVTGSFTCA